MPTLRGHRWLAIALSIAPALSGMFAGTALAGGHGHTTQYDLVQGYIIQGSSCAPATPATCQNQQACVPSASPQSPAASAPAPQAPQPVAATAPQVPVASLPAPATTASVVNVQAVATPVQVVPVSYVQAAPAVQYVAVAAAPPPVQYIAVQAAQPAVAAAPVVQATQTQCTLTPVQLLIPHQKCRLLSHFLGH